MFYILSWVSLLPEAFSLDHSHVSLSSDDGVPVLEGKGDLVREVPRGVKANQHDVLVLCGKKSLVYSKINIFEKCDILSCSGRCRAQVWHCGSRKADWGLLQLSFTWPCFFSTIFPHIFPLLKVMEKSCEPQTEQMCNPPKKQPTQEKVHQVSILKEICF